MPALAGASSRLPHHCKALADFFITTTILVLEDRITPSVRAKIILGTVLAGIETKPTILENFVSKTLAQGKYTVVPKPQALGIQESSKRLKNGGFVKKLATSACSRACIKEENTWE